jgi:D-lactate dehydrogenase
MSLDVFFYEAFEEEVPLLKRHLPRDIRAAYSPAALQAADQPEPPAPLISIRTQSDLPLEWAPRLRGILARSTGYDHLLAYGRQAGAQVALGALPKYCGRAVAEQAMLLWTALLRKLPQQLESFHAFHRDGLTGLECERRTILVVGVGDIGYQVVRIGRGLGMSVLGVDIVQRHADVTYASLAEGLRIADVIVCAMNLTESNRAYFRHETLRGAKKGALFINIARGELSPAGDLLRLLDENVLGGVALDVFNDEPSLATALRKGAATSGDEVESVRKLSRHPRTLLTPHNAFNTVEALNRKAELSAKQVAHFIRNGAFLWPLDHVAEKAD